MRKLLFLPVLALMLACSDAAVFQPDESAVVQRDDLAPAAAVTQRMTFAWQETFDQQYAGETSVTPSGILHMKNIDNGFFAAGDLVGYAHVYGRAMIDTRTGLGNGSGTAHYDLTEPGVGTLDCNWHSKLYEFPVFVQYGESNCTGTGYFEGWKMKAMTTNESNPGVGIYSVTAEMR